MQRLARVLSLSALIAMPGPAAAGHERWLREEPPSYAPYSTADARITLEQAIQSVQRATGGRVLDAREVRGGYRIKVLTQRGEVRVVYVDASTGEMR
jgi:uncharacterized membrane protein YkoI